VPNLSKSRAVPVRLLINCPTARTGMMRRFDRKTKRVTLDNNLTPQLDTYTAHLV
jgi:predicted transcriptional regulator